MKKSKLSGIKLNSYDDLFGKAEQKGDIQNLPIHKLLDFKDHPFKVLDNEDMEVLLESIKEQGILMPILVRQKGEDYEIISGHRRTYAAKKLGFETIPGIVRDMEDWEAVVFMADSNLHREKLLPSEKARAYRMKMDALNHQGIKGGHSSMEMGKEQGISGRQIHRYIRLTYLVDGLLNMVDEKKITMQIGVALSYLQEQTQIWLQELIEEFHKVPTAEQIEKMKTYESVNTVTKEILQMMLFQKKPVTSRKFTMKQESIRKYFPNDYDSEQIEAVILVLLEQWKKEQEASCIL